MLRHRTERPEPDWLDDPEGYAFEEEMARQVLVRELDLPSDTPFDSAVATRDAQRRASERITLVQADGSEVLSGGPARYQSLDAAQKDLLSTLAQGENLKLKAARIVQAIADQELYVQSGFPTFKAYLPTLLQMTAAVGWHSDRTIKSYLQFVRVYLEQAGLPEVAAMRAISHLNVLSKTATVNRATNELVEEGSAPKLGAEDFCALSRVVTYLANAAPGSDLGELDLLDVDAQDVEIFQRLAGFMPAVPDTGWQVAHTKELVDHLLGKDKEEEVKVTRVWVASAEGDGSIRIHSLLFEQEGTIWEAFEFTNKVVSWETFARMTKGDKIDGLAEEA